MIIGFAYAYEYTYQDREYIIRTRNTEHAQLVTKPYTYQFFCSWLHTRLHSCKDSLVIMWLCFE